MTAAAGTVKVFHAPLTGALIVPCERSAPGCPLASEYRPTITRDAAFVGAKYKTSCATLPEAVAVAWKASAEPAELLSAPVWMVALPISVAAPAEVLVVIEIVVLVDGQEVE